jgi:hypothetical protein
MDPAILRSACPEKQLLACCARTRVEGDLPGRIRALAGSPLDWDYLLAQAEKNSVVALLERNLRKSASETLPANYAAGLQAAMRAHAIRCLAQTSEFVRVAGLIKSRGIRALPYKGPVIAAQAYGDITARQFDDLDIILSQQDIPAADAAVRSLGYQPRFPWIHSPEAKSIVPGEYNYFNPARQTILELHTEATLRHFPVRSNLQQFFKRSVIVDLGGQSLRTFCPEDALAVYCIHGAKDFWDRLVWVADVAELLRAFPDLDWDMALRSGGDLGAGRMLHLGLALAIGILDATVPKEITKRVKEDSGASALAADVSARLLDRDTRKRTARERFRFRRQTVEGNIAGWRYAMRLTLAPAEEDWQHSNLPGSLAPFRVALRPFRLLRKYSSPGKQ